MNIPQFVYPFYVDKHLGYFQFLVTVNKISLGIFVHISLWLYILVSEIDTKKRTFRII